MCDAIGLAGVGEDSLPESYGGGRNEGLVSGPAATAPAVESPAALIPGTGFPPAGVPRVVVPAANPGAGSSPRPDATADSGGAASPAPQGAGAGEPAKRAGAKPQTRRPAGRAGDLLRHWKRHVRRAAPAERWAWLESAAGAAAFAADPATRLELLRRLRKLRDAVARQACSEPWFQEVWRRGRPYAPPCPCGCDGCRLRRFWPANHYVGSTGLSFECAAEGRMRQWYLLPSSASARAIHALGELTRTDPRTGEVRQGGRLQSPVRMLPESEAALRREIDRFRATGRLAPDRRRVNIGQVGRKK